jgi:hypothetical protein
MIWLQRSATLSLGGNTLAKATELFLVVGHSKATGTALKPKGYVTLDEAMAEALKRSDKDSTTPVTVEHRKEFVAFFWKGHRLTPHL